MRFNFAWRQCLIAPADPQAREFLVSDHIKPGKPLRSEFDFELEFLNSRLSDDNAKLSDRDPHSQWEY